MIINFKGYQLDYLSDTVPVKEKFKVKKILKNGDTYRNLISFFKSENEKLLANAKYHRHDSHTYEYVIEAIEKKHKILKEDKQYHKLLKSCGIKPYKL